MHHMYATGCVGRWILLCVLVFFCGCASLPEHKPGPFVAPVHRGVSALPDQSYRPFLVEDPWEGFNLRMYRFNAQLDRYVYLPVIHAYEEVVPEPVRHGVSNVFNNLKEIPLFVNAVLQGNPKKASVSLGRFVFNTTLGLGGIIDVLGTGGITQEREDFGQTLGVWGVDSGPYLVLPVLGPSGVRDACGSGVDALMTLNPSDMLFDGLGWAARSASTVGVYGLKAVDSRQQVKFRYYQTGSPFEYQLVRFIYTKKRELDVAQ